MHNGLKGRLHYVVVFRVSWWPRSPSEAAFFIHTEMRLEDVEP